MEDQLAAPLFADCFVLSFYFFFLPSKLAITGQFFVLRFILQFLLLFSKKRESRRNETRRTF